MLKKANLELKHYITPPHKQYNTVLNLQKSHVDAFKQCSI